MTKQLEDYPELVDIKIALATKAVEDDDGCYSLIKIDDIQNIVLELAQQLESKDKEIKRLTELDLEMGFAETEINLLKEENEKLKSRVLESENIFYQLIEEQALYCSDFGNLLPVADQDSEVVRKAIGFMNSHIQKFKELSNDN